MITGIDVSKDTLDLTVISEGKPVYTGKVSNDKKGFKALLNHVKDSHVVMEATGPHYVQLALFLTEKKVKVSVVNPLVIKRFCQMRMSRAKTDRKDALLIAQYGQAEKPDSWKPPSELTFQLQQVETYLEGLKKKKGILLNQVREFKSRGVVVKSLDKDIQEEIKDYNHKKDQKEQLINDLINKEYSGLVANLKSIPGIGDRSA